MLTVLRLPRCLLSSTSTLLHEVASGDGRRWRSLRRLARRTYNPVLCVIRERFDVASCLGCIKPFTNRICPRGPAALRAPAKSRSSGMIS
jgi:hypothetical protein